MCDESIDPEIFIIPENANHSPETGDVKTDLKNLQMIMDRAEEYPVNGLTLR